MKRVVRNESCINIKIIYYIHMLIEPPIGDALDIQNRFSITADSPLEREKTLYFNFQMDEIRMGCAQIFWKPENNDPFIIWKFYPIDRHNEEYPELNWF